MSFMTAGYQGPIVDFNEQVCGRLGYGKDASVDGKDHVSEEEVSVHNPR
ncbi:MAG TPA: hypothetical protein VIL63_07770 [Terriglobales bacterium]